MPSHLNATQRNATNLPLQLPTKCCNNMKTILDIAHQIYTFGQKKKNPSVTNSPKKICLILFAWTAFKAFYWLLSQLIICIRSLHLVQFYNWTIQYLIHSYFQLDLSLHNNYRQQLSIPSICQRLCVSEISNFCQFYPHNPIS